MAEAIIPEISDEPIDLKLAAIFATRNAQYWAGVREKIGRLQQAEATREERNDRTYDSPEDKATVLAAHDIELAVVRKQKLAAPTIAGVRAEIAKGRQEQTQRNAALGLPVGGGRNG